MVTDTIKAALLQARLEELRFAKRQQWTITAAVIGLIFGAYNVVEPLGPYEKVIATVAITLVVGGGIYLLFDLQGHLRRTRLVIDRYDREAGHRGLAIVYEMAIALIISAIAVCYLEPVSGICTER